MNIVKNWLSNNKDLFRILIILIILLISLGLFLSYFGKIGNSESFNVVLGISLGVFVGFFADAAKKDWDIYQQRKIFKKTVLKLLEQDAKSIFRTYEMWSDMRKTIGKPGTPPGIENYLPPSLEMKYWDKLSQKDDFLLLAEDEKFERILRSFWDFEKVAKLIEEATKGDKTDERTKQAYMFAMVMSQQTLTDKSHESFLTFFLTAKEIEEFVSSPEKYVSSYKELLPRLHLWLLAQYNHTNKNNDAYLIYQKLIRYETVL